MHEHIFVLTPDVQHNHDEWDEEREVANAVEQLTKLRAAGYHTIVDPAFFRIDMHDCPSKGQLIKLGQEEYHDYCQHCMGWIGPIMDAAGFNIDHEHNHQGQCWWEMHPAEPGRPAQPPPIRDEHDVRLREDWRQARHDLWLQSKQEGAGPT